MSRPRTIADACPHMSAAVRRLNPNLASKPPAVDMSHDPHDVTPSKPTLRQKRGPKLNKTEAAFEQHLRVKFPAKIICTQGITLTIGNGVRYTPDFSTWAQLGDTFPAFFEVKGFMRDDAAVKLKVAAAMYPQFMFFLVHRDKSMQSGWRIEEVLP